MRVTPIGYGFDRRANSEWRPLDRKPFADHIWPDGTRAALESGDITRITFDPTGLVDPARITLVREDERVIVEIDADGGIRSEEHTSELQSLMRISYAVFCLHKKKCKQT